MAVLCGLPGQHLLVGTLLIGVSGHLCTMETDDHPDDTEMLLCHSGKGQVSEPPRSVFNGVS